MRHAKRETLRTSIYQVYGCRTGYGKEDTTFDAFVEATVVRVTNRYLIGGSFWSLPNKYYTEMRLVEAKGRTAIDPSTLTHESQLRVRETMMRAQLYADDFVQRYRLEREEAIIRADDIDAAGKEVARRIRAFGHGYELRSLQNVRVTDIFEREDTGK